MLRAGSFAGHCPDKLEIRRFLRYSKTLVLCFLKGFYVKTDFNKGFWKCISINLIVCLLDLLHLTKG